MTELKTWQDLANNYDLVLFNNVINVGNGEVLEEWCEQHTCGTEEDKNNEDYQCECEIYQWFAIGLDEWQFKKLNNEFNLHIFYSDYLGIYILPVSHFGTAWRMLNLAGGYATEDQDND